MKCGGLCKNSNNSLLNCPTSAIRSTTSLFKWRLTSSKSPSSIRVRLKPYFEKRMRWKENSVFMPSSCRFIPNPSTLFSPLFSTVSSPNRPTTARGSTPALREWSAKLSLILQSSISGPTSSVPVTCSGTAYLHLSTVRATCWTMSFRRIWKFSTLQKHLRISSWSRSTKRRKSPLRTCRNDMTRSTVPCRMCWRKNQD